MISKWSGEPPTGNRLRFRFRAVRAGEAKLRVRVRVVSLNAGVAAVENSVSSSSLLFSAYGLFSKTLQKPSVFNTFWRFYGSERNSGLLLLSTVTWF